HLFRQHRPCDACQFIGDRNDYFVPWGSRFQLMDPLAKTASVVLHSQQHGTSAVDEHTAQVDVASLADAVQFCVATGRVLSRYQAEPGCTLTSLVECGSVADRGDRGGRN